MAIISLLPSGRRQLLWYYYRGNAAVAMKKNPNAFGNGIILLARSASVGLYGFASLFPYHEYLTGFGYDAGGRYLLVLGILGRPGELFLVVASSGPALVPTASLP